MRGRKLDRQTWLIAGIALAILIGVVLVVGGTDLFGTAGEETTPVAQADSDGDGVADDVDACPQQGDAGYGVDATGCPNPAPQPVSTEEVQAAPLTSGLSVGFTAFIDAAGIVHFTNTSAGEFQSWEWSFGDNTTSTDQNPSHTYASAGTYNVTLKGTATDGTVLTAVGTVTITESQAAPMRCEFEMQPQGQQAPLTVNFVNKSSNVTSYAWNFGDGGTSTDANPSHIYQQIGTYNITLDCTGALGTLQATGQLNITETEVQTPLIARFTANPVRGPAPLAVQFTDSSQGTGIQSWSWAFGDGNTSSDQNPSHSYAAMGKYTVTLTVSDASGNSSSVSGTIDVIEQPTGPTPSFTVSPQEGDAPLTVTVTDTTQGEITSWEWTFGDGGTATGEGPHQHTYQSFGTYTISLKVNGPNGGGTATKQVVVLQPGAKVEAIFSFTYSGPFNNGQEVCFVNSSTGTITKYEWDFGDGSTSTDQAPCHTYAAEGNYTATLKVTGEGGEISTGSRIVAIVRGFEAPVAKFSVNRTEIQIGEQVVLTNQSTGLITSYEWTFGDGSTSTEENPSHTYTTNGTFVITLRVTGPGGSSEATQVSINVGLPQIGCSISGPGTVNFYGTGNYSGSVTGLSGRTAVYRWTLNGTEVSADVNFSQQFTTAGQFDLNFEVLVNGTVECSATKRITVQEDNLNCDFSGDLTPLLEQPVNYVSSISNLNGRSVISHTWQLNGQNVGTEPTLSQTWTVAGEQSLTYIVELENGTKCEKTKTVIVANSTVECSIQGSEQVWIYQTADYNAIASGLGVDTATYNWKANGQSVGSGNKLSYKFTAETTLDLEVVIGGEVKCTATKKITLRNNGGEGLTCGFTGSTSPLLTQSINYQGSYSNAFGRTVTFQWKVGDSEVGTGQNLSYTWNTGGKFTLTFIVTPSEGTPCSISKTITVAGSSVTCSISGTNNPRLFQPGSWTGKRTAVNTQGLTYRWTMDGAEVATTQNLSNYVFTTPGNHSLGFEVIQNGTVACSASKNIAVQQDNFTCAIDGNGNPLLLQTSSYTARISNSAGRTVTYEWKVNGNSIGTQQSVTQTWSQSGEQELTLIATPAQGQPCTATKKVTVSEESLLCTINGEFSPYAGQVYSYSAGVQGLGQQTATYEWKLNGEVIGTGQSLDYTFGSEGTVSLVLDVTTTENGPKCTVSGEINVQAGQRINAHANPESGIAPLFVNFTADTTNIDRSTLTWYYPDGSHHRAETSGYRFDQPGEYTIRVTGVGPLGEQEATVKVNVGTTTDIRAAFTPSRWGGIAPMQVCFTDGSQGDQITEWNWDLGNGQTSTEQNPCTDYTTLGTFNVTLTVRNVHGLTAMATNIIKTYSVTEGSSSFDVEYGPEGKVCFYSKLTEGLTVGSWDFGDGGTSTEANPCHTYTDGEYTVTLIVKGAETESAITRSIKVQVYTSTELPSLRVAGICTQNTAEFTVVNNGGPMSEADTYTITDANGNELQTGSFQLAKNESKTFTVANASGVVTFTAAKSQLSASTECGRQLSCQKNNPERVDCSSLAVTGICLEDGTAQFTIRNTGEAGDGDMLQPTEWRLVDDAGNVVQSGPILLKGGETMQVTYTGGIQITLFADQQIGHPGSSRPQETLACTPNLPEVKYEAVCAENGVATFTITNSGGAMTQPEAYQILDSQNNVVKDGSYQLGKGETATVVVTGVYGELRFSTPAGVPVSTICVKPPQVKYEAVCAENGVATFTITNSGGAMTQPEAYQILDSQNNVVKDGSYQLGEGESMTVEVTGVYDQLRFSTPAGVPVSTICTEQSKVTYGGICAENGVATFTITNSGGAMTQPEAYQILDSQETSSKMALTSWARAKPPLSK